MFRSVYTRLLVIFLLVLTAAMAFLSVALYRPLRADKTEARLKELVIQAEDLAYLASQRSVFGSFQTDRYLQWKCEKIDREFGAYIVILDRMGNLIQGSGGKTDIPLEQTMQFLSHVVESGDILQFRTDGEGENPVFTIGVPWVEEGRVLGAVFIHTSEQTIEASFDTIVVQLMKALMLALAVGAVLTLLSSQYITRPLQAMADAAERFAHGNFEQRVLVSPGRKDEIGSLAEAFNSMATELEQLEENRRTFVANVSHELRSPLTSIQGFINGMLDGTVSEEDREHYLGIVLDETRRLNKLINTLLDLSSIESGKTPLNKTSFDINEMILRVLARQEADISRRNIDVDIQFAQETCMVCADADRMEQVIVNLVSNAMKYMGETDGKLTLITENHEKTALICVQDNGPGISPEDLPHVFDRFYMADKAHTSGKGTGLGLAIVKSILEQHGHTIKADSVLGEGTRFEFILDRAS